MNSRLLPWLPIVALPFSVVVCAFAADAPKTDAKSKASSKGPEPRRAPTLANVPYGDHERQKVDIYLPPGAKDLPVVFWIHGGGWQAGDKKDGQIKLKNPRHNKKVDRRQQKPVPTKTA